MELTDVIGTMVNDGAKNSGMKLLAQHLAVSGILKITCAKLHHDVDLKLPATVEKHSLEQVAL